MEKKEALARWESLAPDQPILKHMAAIPYKAKGSKYGTCGIRIDGTPAFVDAVLSHLKELIKGEGVGTRLGLARSEVGVVKTANGTKGFGNKVRGAECCYIRLHERGDEGKHLAAFVEGARRRNAANAANAPVPPSEPPCVVMEVENTDGADEEWEDAE